MSQHESTQSSSAYISAVCVPGLMRIKGSSLFVGVLMLLSRPLSVEITRTREIAASSVCLCDCVGAHGSGPANASGFVCIL